jgi:hypothetical protein
MKKTLCIALLALAVVNVRAEVPANWPKVGPIEHFIPASVERFGNTMYFATASKGVGQTWWLSWYWAHCQGRWVTAETAFIGKEDEKAQAAYSKAASNAGNTFLSPIEVQSLASRSFGDGEALRAQLSARCKTAGQSQADIELPVSSSAGKANEETDLDFLVLRTAIKRGELAEGWFRKRPTKREQDFAPDGTVRLNSNGEPMTRRVFTEHDTSARFKVTANCQERQFAISRWVEYDKMGKVTSSTKEDAKLSFSEPIPGTLGETYLEALCRLL